MASYVETTAVALRRGDHTANMQFTGTQGEVVVDLGDGQGGILGVDGNTTLRLHNGVTTGGIAMARADTKNITSQVLAENRQTFDDKNLAYADLSNIETTENEEAQNLITTTLNQYGIATKSDLDAKAATLANKDMSNVETSTLATGRGRGTNGNLAYADMSNVNTKDLTDATVHDGVDGDKPLSYADFSNGNTENLTLDIEDRPENMSGPALARKDLQNITKEEWSSALFNSENELNLERTTNKDDEIPDEIGDITPGHYPTTSAVNKFVKAEIFEGSFLRTDLINIDSYEPLYSNGKNATRYLSSSDYINEEGTKFTEHEKVWTGKQTGNIDYLKFIIGNIDTEGKATKLELMVPCGLNDLSSYPQITLLDTDENGKDINKITVKISSTKNEDTGLYTYEITEFTVDTFDGSWTPGTIIVPEEKIALTGLLFAEVLEIGTNGELKDYNFYPEYGKNFFADEEIIFTPADTTGTVAKIKFRAKKIIPDIGPGRLAKTDLSNLLGMDELDIEAEQGNAWRIRHDESLPSIHLNYVTDPEKESLTIPNRYAVWLAIKETKNYIEQTSSILNWKADTEYVAEPEATKVIYNGTIYYCITAHTSGDTFDASKWKAAGNTTFEALANKEKDLSNNTTSDIKYPTNKAVTSYVAEQINNIHLPDHYKGQVNVMVETEANLPTAGLVEGYQVLIKNYNNTNKPIVASYHDSAWTYDEIYLENGIYFYVLDLGTEYHNGPGNATWNADNNAFDIAPDKFQVPDGKTLNLNDSTGAIQIVPELQTKLGYVDVKGSIQTSLNGLDTRVTSIENTIKAMVIPAPQFFTSTGTTGQVLTLTDNVAFDLYVSGVFQYPNTYTFDETAKTVTLNFSVENSKTNDICIVYRGFRKA